MASMIIGQLVHEYQDYIENRSDLRSKDWFLMSSPWPTVTLSLTYVLLSKWLGPRFMKGRQPYDLRMAIVIYNGIQVLVSAFLFYEFGQGGWFHSYNFTCQPVDYSNNPTAIRMLTVSWLYFLSKFSEFVDTFFFILRGKMNHVSNLHVIHHGIMPVSVWLGLKFTPGGHSSFMGLCNTFVHVIMYFYYMMSALGPRYAKFIWWKKYLTNIQIGQFILVSFHTFQLLFRECDYPKFFVWLIGLHSLLFLGLFLNFHIQTYWKPKRVISKAGEPRVDEKMERKRQISGSKSNGSSILNTIKSGVKEIRYSLKKHV